MIAAVFPGQGSQKPGMGVALAAASSEAAAVFEQVSTAVGFDVLALCRDSDDDTLRQTQNAQLALFTCGVAAFRARPEGEIFAGHSVGEYAALTAAGVLSVEAGARLVQVRGQLMASAGAERPGTMAAVLGLDRDALERVCAQASTATEIVVIANDNCPGQLVVSGDPAAVTRVGEIAPGTGAKRVLPLNVSGAFHSPLMEKPAAEMGQALQQAEFSAGKPVVANVTAKIETEGWASLLEAQLRSPVRWTESVQFMIAHGVTEFVEYGGGEVLGGLIRRVSKEVSTRSFGGEG